MTLRTIAAEARKSADVIRFLRNVKARYGTVCDAIDALVRSNNLTYDQGEALKNELHATLF